MSFAQPDSKKPSLLKIIRWHAESGALRLFWWIMGRMSPERASASGDWLLRRLGPGFDKMRRIKANLAMALPDREAAEIDRLARGVLGNIGAVTAEFAHVKTLVSSGEANPHIETVCLNEDPDFINRRKPCIFVSAHLGNWELTAAAIVAFGYPASAVYTPLSNPWLDRLISDKRSDMQVGTIARSNALRPLLKSLKQGRSVGILTDVRVDDKNLLPVFGTGAGLTKVPAWLAMKTGCDIVPAYCVRTGHARFRVTIYPALPRPPEGTAEDEAVRQLTMEMIRMHEARIREHPDQWMCTNRRWPKQVMRERGIY